MRKDDRAGEKINMEIAAGIHGPCCFVVKVKSSSAL